MLENRSEEWCLGGKLQKEQVGRGKVYGTLWDLNSAPVRIQPVLWVKQSDEKIPCHYIIKVCSIIQIRKGSNKICWDIFYVLPSEMECGALWIF